VTVRPMGVNIHCINAEAIAPEKFQGGSVSPDRGVNIVLHERH